VLSRYNYSQDEQSARLAHGPFFGLVFLVVNFLRSSGLAVTTRGKGVSRMGRRIRVRAIKKEEPNIGLYVLALIALARELQEQEDQQAATVPTPQPAADSRKEANHERD
jgi:hypothetical protein